MANHIKIRKAPGIYSIRSAGAVLGESSNVIEVSEGGLPAMLYVPREDLAMAFFDKTKHTSVCPYKGTATYYTIQAKSGPIPNAAWSYEETLPEVEQIKGHLAFYPDFATVEQV